MEEQHTPARLMITGAGVGAFAGAMFALSYAAITKTSVEIMIPLGLGCGSLAGHLGTLKILQPKPEVIQEPQRIYPHDEPPLDVNINDFDKPYPKGRRGGIRHKKKLPELARLILVMGKSYSYADLEGKGKLYGRTEYEHVRSDLMDLGLLYWKNPDNHRDGCDFTVGGIAFLKRIRREYEASPPLRTRFSPGFAGVE